MSDRDRPDGGTERGAYIPPSDVYCDPEIAEDSALHWEIRPVEKLEEAGMYPCPFCHHRGNLG